MDDKTENVVLKTSSQRLFTHENVLFFSHSITLSIWRLSDKQNLNKHQIWEIHVVDEPPCWRITNKY